MPFTAFLARVRRNARARATDNDHHHRPYASADDPIFLPMIEPSPRRSSLIRRHASPSANHIEHPRQLTQSLRVQRDEDEELVDPFSTTSSSSQSQSTSNASHSPASTSTPTGGAESHAPRSHSHSQSQTNNPRHSTSHSHSHSQSCSSSQHHQQPFILRNHSHHHHSFHNNTLHQRHRNTNSNQAAKPTNVHSDRLPSDTDALKRQVQHLLTERAEATRVLIIAQQLRSSNRPLSLQTTSTTHINGSAKSLVSLMQDALQSFREERAELKRRLFKANAKSRQLTMHVNALQRGAAMRSATVPRFIAQPMPGSENALDGPNSAKIFNSGNMVSSGPRVRINVNGKIYHSPSSSLVSDFVTSGNLDDDDDDDDEDDIRNTKDTREVVSEPSSLDDKGVNTRSLHALLRVLRDERMAATMEKNRLLRELHMCRGETRRLRTDLYESSNALTDTSRGPSIDKSNQSTEDCVEMTKPSNDVEMDISEAVKDTGKDEKMFQMEEKLKVHVQQEREAEQKAQKIKAERDQYVERLEVAEQENRVLQARLAGYARARAMYEDALHDTRGEMNRLRGRAGELQQRVLNWRAQTRHKELMNAALVTELRQKGEELAKKVDMMRVLNSPDLVRYVAEEEVLVGMDLDSSENIVKDRSEAGQFEQGSTSKGEVRGIRGEGHSGDVLLQGKAAMDVDENAEGPMESDRKGRTDSGRVSEHEDQAVDYESDGTEFDVVTSVSSSSSYEIKSGKLG